AAPEGPCARAHPAARSTLGGRAARPARPRLRPRRDRGLPRPVRRAGQRRARPAVVPAVAALARVAARPLRAGRRPRRRVARRRPAQCSARGGGGIQALRQARTRLTLAGSSALAYCAVLAYAIALDPKLGLLTGALGGLGALLLFFVLARALEEALAWALLFLGVAYAVALVAGGAAVDEGVPLVAVGLLLCGELAAWSLEERHGIAVDRAVLAARALAVGVLAAAGLAAAAIVVALAAVPA